MVVVDQLTDVTGLCDRHTVCAFRVAPLPIRALVLTDAAWVLAGAALSRLAGAAGWIADLTVRAIITALIIDDLTQSDIPFGDAVLTVRVTQLAWRTGVHAAALLVQIAARVFRHAVMTILITDLTLWTETLTLILSVDLAGVKVLRFARLAARVAVLTLRAIVVADPFDHRALRRGHGSAFCAVRCALLSFWTAVLTKIAVHHTKIGRRVVLTLPAVGVAALPIRTVITADIPL